MRGQFDSIALLCEFVASVRVQTINKNEIENLHIEQIAMVVIILIKNRIKLSFFVIMRSSLGVLRRSVSSALFLCHLLLFFIDYYFAEQCSKKKSI